MATLLVSSRQALRDSLPSFLDPKKPTWPNATASIGPECLIVNGLGCWQVVGPALEIMAKLSRPVEELLNKHQEDLEHGECKPSAISFNMRMIGSCPSSAIPTLVISSRNRKKRTLAKALIKQSKLLNEYPGVRVKTLDKKPAVYTGGEDEVYILDDSHGLCGAPIIFGRSGIATMGGVLSIGGAQYGISVQHARFESIEEEGDGADENKLPCFDEDSDTESIGCVQITSKSEN